MLARSPCDEGVIRGYRPHAETRAPASKRWTLAATILGSSMAFIDGSVVSVALPAMQADLQVGVREAQWIVNSYMLLLGALILVGGAIGDQFGRRRGFMLGISLFTAASVACGLSPNAAALIAARAAQGIGGALLVPACLAIISAVFPEQERGRAIGTWAGASALTTALGPVLGGWLVDVWSWRAIFFLNVPIAAGALLLALRHMPESRNASQDSAVDWRGGVLATIGLGALAYGFTAASESGWLRPAVIGSLIIGIIMLLVFLRVEVRARSPMMPLNLFRSRTFSGANAITLLLYFALSGVMFFVPFNLIRVQGYSATAAGAAFLPFSLIMGTLSRWTGGLFDHYGARMPLTIGPVIVAAGFVWLAVPGIGGAYWTTFFGPMVVLGVGMAVAVPPLTTTVMRAVDDSHSGVASGVNNATARIAGMLAVAVLGAIAVFIFRNDLDRRVTASRAPPEIHRALLQEAPKLAEAQAPKNVEPNERQRLTRVLQESFVRSFRVTMLISAAMALLSALCALVFIEPAQRARHHAPAMRQADG
jgi:EmrB/QacA subfamily drug resistance transporter